MKKLLTIILIAIFLIPAFGAREISLTIYNQNLALVHDVRRIDFKKGVFSYSYSDIPSQIDPTSVHFHAGKVEILEQNYEFDLASVRKIMDKFVGETIRVFVEDGSMFEGELQTSPDDIILVDKSGAVNVVRRDKIVHSEFPQMPENFVQRPTLIWTLKSEASGKRKAEVSYLTGGMNWHAEYVGVVKGKDKLSLAGWVSVENRSGAAFENAKLKLMAGDVHLVSVPTDGRRRFVQGTMALKAEAQQFEEKEFFEYHLYTLQRPATVKNNQIKQISFFPETEVKCKRIYLYDQRKSNKNIIVSLEFKNYKSEGLGMALPAGKVRIYQEDEDKSLEFVGEDNIKHTPRDEKVSIQVGKAFDLVGERTVVDSRKIGRRDREDDVEIKLRNHKKEAVTITVRERFYGDWRITNPSHKYDKTDANTIEFKVDVPPHKPEEELIITYTVHYSYK